MRNTALRRAQLWVAAGLSGLGLLGALAWMPEGLDRVEPSRPAAVIAGTVTVTVTSVGRDAADVMLGGQEVRLRETGGVKVGDEVRLYLTTEERNLVVQDAVVDGALVGLDAERVKVSSTRPLLDQDVRWYLSMALAWGPASLMLSLLVLAVSVALRRRLTEFNPVTWFLSPSLLRGVIIFREEEKATMLTLFGAQVVLTGVVAQVAPDLVFENVWDALYHVVGFLLNMTATTVVAMTGVALVGVLDHRLAVTPPSEWKEGELLEVLLNGGVDGIDMSDPLLAGIERETLEVLSRSWSGTLEELLTTARLLGPDVEVAPAPERRRPPLDGAQLRRSLVGVA